MIKVLIVDDSSLQRELLTYILSSDPDIKVIGTASDGEEAVKMVPILKPDLVTMDINLPKMNGIEAIRHIMAQNPLPIVVISGSDSKREVSYAIEAIEAGAVTILEKKSFSPEIKQPLINVVKIMSEVKVVRRLHKRDQMPLQKVNEILPNNQIQLIAIGASTGGPLVLQKILNEIVGSFPPIVIVQHIADGFLEGLVTWLGETTHKTITIASQNDALQPDHVYFAPVGFQIGVDGSGRIALKSEVAQNGHTPSVDYLFNSIALEYKQRALPILLTGMGRDGADALKKLKTLGATTIVQDKESSVVYGMPGEAIAINGASLVLTPPEIVQFINQLNKRDHEA